MKWLIIAAVGQWTACCLLGAGIAIEIVRHADVGYLAITLGSALFAGVTKAEYHARKWLDHKRAGNRRGIDRDSSGGD